MYQHALEATTLRIRPKLLQGIFGLEDCINELCAALIVEYFQENGSFSEGQLVSLDLLRDRFSILPKYHRMLDFFIAVLERQELVSVQGDMVLPTSKLFELNGSEFYLDKLRIMYPKFSYFLTFVSQCAKKYHNVLSGKMPGTSLLFPSGDTEKLERLYKSTPKLGYEEVMLHTLKAIVQKMSQSKEKFSVLEIGGGQGILTSVLNPLVGNGISEYCFSDIAKAFVDRARQRLTKPEYRFATMDCTKELSSTCENEAAYDLVVGFNVVHATPNISATLANLSRITKPGGSMIFVENTKQEIWIDMLYGMVDGWWSFEDEYRTVSPLLTVPQWNDLLSKEKYSSYEVLPGLDVHDQYETGLIVINK